MAHKLYSAYSVLAQPKGEYAGLIDLKVHMTVAFMDANDTGKLPFSNLPDLEIRKWKIEYWEKPDLTVVIPEGLHVGGGSTIYDIRRILDDMGYTYGPLEFVPHITMCKGNQVDLVSNLLQGYDKLYLVRPYLRVKDFPDEA